MASTVENVASFLEAEGLAGGSTEWILMRRRIMDTPKTNQLVVVSEDGGPPSEIPAAEGIGDSAMRDSGVIVTVRADPWDGDSSSGKAEEIRDALHGLIAADVGEQMYHRVRAMTSEPVFAGFDDKNRPLHTIAFRLLSSIN